MRSPRNIGIAAFVLSSLVWIFHALRWWAHLDGDFPLYSVMSVEVLRGHHFVMTAAQSHGGTILVYLRAAVFALFGVSAFAGVFVNGLVVSAGLALWTRFAALAGGPIAGFVMAALGAFGTETFVKYASTDYYAMSVFFGGVFLNLAWHWAHTTSITRPKIFGTGALTGLGLYSCPFALLSLLPAFALFMGLTSEVRRAYWLPSSREMRSKISRVLQVVAIVAAVLALLAFLTNDQFFGVNAEQTVKFTVKVLIAFWLWHRFRMVITHPMMTLTLALGFVAGFAPQIIFNLTRQHKALATGLVRLGDIRAAWPDLVLRLGVNFSAHDPRTIGHAALASALVALALGFYAAPGKSRRVYVAALFGVALAFGAWIGMHTYMYLATQYFFSTFFALYLALALAVSRSKYPHVLVVLIAPLITGGLNDLLKNWHEPNVIAESGVLDTLANWESKYATNLGYGHYPTNYNVMMASLGKWKLPFVEKTERFPEWQDQVDGASRIFHVLREGDRAATWQPEGYRVLESVRLRHGFSAEILEKPLLDRK